MNINTPQYWDRKYNKIGGRWGENSYHFLKDKLENKFTLLDIGCGRGAGIDYLSKLYASGIFTGIDFSKNGIEVAKSKKILNSSFYVSDCYKFECGNYDYILMIELLEHLRWPEKIIEKYLSKANKAIFISIPSHQWECNEHVYAYKNIANPFEKYGAELILKDHGRSKFIIRK